MLVLRWKTMRHDESTNKRYSSIPTFYHFAINFETDSLLFACYHNPLTPLDLKFPEQHTSQK
jgi:hypothetical protein